MKNWKYPIDTVIIVNEKAQNGMSGEVGKYAVVVDLLKTDSYDYEIKLEDGSHGKFKEEELDYFFKLGDIMKVNSSGEEGLVITRSLKYKQVELRFLDNSYRVYNFSEVKPVDFVDEIIKIHTKHKEEKKVSNANLHQNILNEKHDIFVRKNADYGNSFSEQFKEYGLLSAVIRLDDKLRRLKQLLKNEAKVKDESIRDTLLDLSNYADMTIMELDKESELNAE